MTPTDSPVAPSAAAEWHGNAVGRAGGERTLQRYKDGDRMNHWAVAMMFVLAALSGLVFFHPALYFLSNLFGGGPWARILHPMFGVLMFVLFIGMFIRFAGANRITDADRAWRAKMGDLVRGHKAGMPAVGKYNWGQKMVFWVFGICLLVLVVTGVMFWRPWFAPYFPIGVIRAAALLHAVAALVLILSAIVHIYAAIWVKGSMRAMTRGTVSDGWARQHHADWHREMTQGK